MLPSIDCYLLCQICLRGDDNVTVMNFKDRNMYETIFPKIAILSEKSYLCIYCRHLMKKCKRFYYQCLAANEYLTQIDTPDLKSNKVRLISKAVDLQICSTSKEIRIREVDANNSNAHMNKRGSNPEKIFYPKSEDDLLETYDCSSRESVNQSKNCEKFDELSERAYHSEDDVKEESLELEENIYSYDDIPLAELCTSSKKDFHNECKKIIKHDKISDDLFSEPKTKTEIFDPKVSEDEVPLADLRENVNECFMNKDKTKRKQNSRRKSKNEKLILDAVIEETKRRKWKTAKHSPREGFSSKMVTETDEYVVIKLSKQQVLNEMLERTKSEKYIRYPYKCEKCVKGFNFDDVLQNHLQRHIPRPGFIECDICYQHCPNIVSFRGHMKSHTTRYKCKICGDIKLSRQHLLEHHALKHTGVVKTYSCEHCSFTTNKRTIMQRHVRNHSNKDSHACDKCGKLFPNITALRTHVVRHSKMEKCEQCGRKFISQSLLHSHVLAVHERKDFYCVECDVKFQSAYNLQLHLKRTRRHRDESSYKYKCPRCPRRYVYQSGVTSHLTSSHGELSTHICQMCDKKYSTSHALRAHKRRNHADEALLNK